MFNCKRCKNTGRITEEYWERPSLDKPLFTGEVKLTDVEPIAIKMREVECPECLGFGAVGWVLPG